ncbi:hypothetical protein GCM10022419_106290 [Nonomuraea rosea]|uniref:DNA-binding protein n=1 Tax=Nonomuraea rosea TaxID=638574 RepID=A0ABP6ZBZ5_9ACTN
MVDEPSRDEIRTVITGLIEGRRSREEVASWAERTMLELEDSRISDMVVWESLQTLSGADLKDSPTTYLHNEDDLHSWLSELA